MFNIDFGTWFANSVTVAGAFSGVVTLVVVMYVAGRFLDMAARVLGIRKASKETEDT